MQVSNPGYVAMIIVNTHIVNISTYSQLHVHSYHLILNYCNLAGFSTWIFYPCNQHNVTGFVKTSHRAANVSNYRACSIEYKPKPCSSPSQLVMKSLFVYMKTCSMEGFPKTGQIIINITPAVTYQSSVHPHLFDK